MDSVNVQVRGEVRSFTHSWDNRANVKTWGTPSICPSRSPKVTDFGTNRKCVYEFLLVRNDNIRPISHRFGDIAGFCPTGWPHPNSTPILGVAVHQMAHVGCPQSQGLKLFGREIIFEEFQPMWSPYLNVTHEQADRQTDKIRSHNRTLCSILRWKLKHACNQSLMTQKPLLSLMKEISVMMPKSIYLSLAYCLSWLKKQNQLSDKNCWILV